MTTSVLSELLRAVEIRTDLLTESSPPTVRYPMNEPYQSRDLEEGITILLIVQDTSGCLGRVVMGLAALGESNELGSNDLTSVVVDCTAVFLHKRLFGWVVVYGHGLVPLANEYFALPLH